jgi:hypothetical protein
MLLMKLHQKIAKNTHTHTHYTPSPLKADMPTWFSSVFCHIKTKDLSRDFLPNKKKPQTKARFSGLLSI